MATVEPNSCRKGRTQGTVYDGEHKAILSHELFDAIQTKLAERKISDSPLHRRKVSLLAGMIRECPRTSHVTVLYRNQGRHYSYYAFNMADGASAPAL